MENIPRCTLDLCEEAARRFEIMDNRLEVPAPLIKSVLDSGCWRSKEFGCFWRATTPIRHAKKCCDRFSKNIFLLESVTYRPKSVSRDNSGASV